MSNKSKGARFMQLEGLRGLAALIVVFHHFLYFFYPALRSGDMSLAHTRFEDNLYDTPMLLIFHGTLAVAVFFVLSGFVLSIGYFKSKDENVVKKLAASRYLRLMLPALASVLIAFSLMSFGVGSLTKDAGDIAGSSNLSKKLNFDTNIVDTVKTGVLDIFVEGKAESKGVPLNNVLWTMHPEFMGSFLVFAFLLLFAKSRYRLVAYVALLFATFGTWFLGFIIGMMIADAYSQGWLKKLQKPLTVAGLTILGLFFAVYPKDTTGTIYQYIDTSVFGVSGRIFYLTIAAALIVLVVLLSKNATKYLQKPLFSRLGRYTFSLYLTHLFVIYTVSSAVVINLHDVIGYNKSILVAALVSLPVFWIVTVLFEKYIDAPSIKFAKYVGAAFRGEVEVDWSKHRGLVIKKTKGLFRRKGQVVDTKDDQSDHAP